ncbi:bacteriophage-type DNA polymerase [Acetobacter aceti NRIC 0242]|uniref:Uracil-DNA glycosylase n=2 Tax=Acetobacter aceti TaxID=435 RepID=A0AB33ID32_ACEAC|nr:uracil-DNA glycosylase [Acetobacter aceti NBRC 14818]GAN58413.1 bacteriophage-type DNA polymerase [Acetobacter aceti NBRC 14818]GBO80654.1 bacteriophage-type DNA polymerase [Acetobacter aceti NRIC 0242]
MESLVTMDAGAVAALLELQIEWGVDVLLDEAPHDRFAEWEAEQAARVAHQTTAPALDGAVRHTAKRRPAISEETRHPAEGGPGGSDAALAALAGITTIAALEKAIDGFVACSLRGTATHTVLPRGPVGARVMVIGDAPDADEDRSGIVFSGESGDLLGRMLASIGRTREEMILAPAIPWRPPGGRPPSPVEVAQCLPMLLRSIALYQPERLLLCGGLATRMILGPDINPARARGSWRTTAWGPEGGPQRPVMTMRHPSQLRAGATARRQIWDDMLLLAVTLDGAVN